MFREIYLKIVLSILVVIAAMLLLQSSLNQLKLRALVAEATSSRLQIAAANIEAAIVRADALGFSMDEMVGLQDLIDRERERDPSIQEIQIVSSVGAPILTTGVSEMTAEEGQQVLRRVLGSGETTSRLDAGPRLYTGRLLFDSSDGVMGAVILTTPTQAYMSQAQTAFDRMASSYALVFAAVAVLLLPFIVFQFSGVRHAYRVLDPNAVTGGQAGAGRTADTAALTAAIADGNEAFADAETEFSMLLQSEDDPKVKTSA